MPKDGDSDNNVRGVDEADATPPDIRPLNDDMNLEDEKPLLSLAYSNILGNSVNAKRHPVDFFQAPSSIPPRTLPGGPSQSQANVEIDMKLAHMGHHGPQLSLVHGDPSSCEGGAGGADLT